MGGLDGPPDDGGQLLPLRLPGSRLDPVEQAGEGVMRLGLLDGPAGICLHRAEAMRLGEPVEDAALDVEVPLDLGQPPRERHLGSSLSGLPPLGPRPLVLQRRLDGGEAGLDLADLDELRPGQRDRHERP